MFQNSVSRRTRLTLMFHLLRAISNSDPGVRGATKTNANPWMNHVLEIYALFMLLGVFTSLFIPETKRITLEELSG